MMKERRKENKQESVEALAKELKTLETEKGGLVSKNDFKSFVKEHGEFVNKQSNEHKEINENLKNLEPLKKLIPTLETIAEERRAYEVMRNKWSGNLRFIGLLVGFVATFVTILYTINKILVGR